MAQRLADGSRVTRRGNGMRHAKVRSREAVQAEWEAVLDYVETNNAVPPGCDYPLATLQHAVAARKA